MSKLLFYLASTLFFTIFTLFVLRKTTPPLKPATQITLSYSNSSYDTEGNNLEQQLSRLPKSLQNKLILSPRYTFTKITNPLKTGGVTSYLKIDNQNYYGAPGGREELNQNIREICAFSLKKDNYSWLGFVNSYNQICMKNPDERCWEDQARQFDFDNQTISQCFNESGSQIVKTEILKPLLLKPQINSQEIDIANIYDKINSLNAN